jgi:hypothetical protein
LEAQNSVEEPTTPALVNRPIRKTTNMLGQAGRCSLEFFTALRNRIQLTPGGQAKLKSQMNTLAFGEVTADVQLNLVIMARNLYSHRELSLFEGDNLQNSRSVRYHV